MTEYNRLSEVLEYCAAFKPLKPMKVAQSVACGSLYLLECGGFHKIGITRNMKRRLECYGVHNPIDIRVLACVKTLSYKGDEQAFKDTYYDRHVRGEWYKLEPNEVEATLDRWFR